MQILSTETITDPHALSGPARNAFYNGMDCMLTYEIMEEQKKQLDPISSAINAFTFGLQRPALKMALRGILIDQQERERMILRLESSVEWTAHVINTYAQALWNKPLNPSSYPQRAEFLYSFLRLPEQRKYDKETKSTRVTTDRAAVEKLLESSFRAKPILTALLSFADAKKALSILKSGIDPDGRIRASFVVAGPVTGRFASRKNVFGTGTNLQNIREEWRVIFTTSSGPLPNRDTFSIPEQYKNLPPVAD
jgi:DNA polymerase I-like protein with 3'-5' exonuclease and polymerase domains